MNPTIEELNKLIQHADDINLFMYIDQDSRIHVIQPGERYSFLNTPEQKRINGHHVNSIDMARLLEWIDSNKPDTYSHRNQAFIAAFQTDNQ